MRPSRRWIAREIERLDPDRDYAAIWRLTSSYGLNEFSLNLVYAHLLPHFYVPSHGADTVWDEGDGKVMQRATQRVEDTVRNNLIWWFYGPSHQKTRTSVENINRLHAFHARKRPGAFAHQEDYVYALAFSAASLHRFFHKLGLPGYTAKQKVAAHRFWQEMGALFVDEAGDPIMDFPEDWDALIAFLEEFESRPWPAHGNGAIVTAAVMDQFAFRFFPAPLHWLARAIVASTYHPTCWRVHSVPVPSAPLRAVLLRAVGAGIRLQRAVLPDARRAYQEDLEALSREDRAGRARAIRTLDDEFAAFFRRRHGLAAR